MIRKNTFTFTKYEEKIISNSSEEEVIKEYNNFIDEFQKKTKEPYLRLKHINKIEVDNITFYKPFDSDVLIFPTPLNETQLFYVEKHQANSPIDLRLNYHYWENRSNKEINYSIILACRNKDNSIDSKIILFKSKDIIFDLNYYSYGRSRSGNFIEIKPSCDKDLIYFKIHNEKNINKIINNKKEEFKKIFENLATIKFMRKYYIIKFINTGVIGDEDSFDYFLTPFIKFRVQFYLNKLFFSIVISNGDKLLITFVYTTNINTNLKSCINYIFNTGIKNLESFLKSSILAKKHNTADLLLKLLAYKKIIDNKIITNEVNKCNQAISG